MSGMTKEERKKLDWLLSEYGVSLDRMEDEKAKQKSMEKMAKMSLKIEPAHFKVLAKSIWKGTQAQAKEDIESQLDLFLLYDQEGASPRGPEPDSPSSHRSGKALLPKNSVVATYDPPGALQ